MERNVLLGLLGGLINAVLASIGTNRSAKRTTIIHLMFNLIGTMIFTILCLTLPIAEFVAALTPGKPQAQIANMHTLFNMGTTMILLPFGPYLAAAATKILPDAKEITQNAIDKLQNREDDMTVWLSDIAAMEQKMDDMTRSYRENHLERMRKGLCNEEACVLYSELLTDFERIGDHVLNIAQAITKIYR